MTRYLLTADVFVGGSLRHKGEIISFKGTPNKAMVEVDSSGKVVVKAKVAEVTTEAPETEASETDANEETEEVVLKAPTKAVSPGKAKARVGG